LIPNWVKDVYTLELRKIFSYRVDFWMEFLGSIGIHLTAAYFLWKAIFEANSASTIGGYTFGHMMVYYLLVPLIEKLVRGHERGNISNEIYDGSLTRYLIYPLSFLGYKFVTNIAVSTIGVLQFFLIMIIYLIFFDVPPTVHFNLTNTVMAFIAIGSASILFFLITASLECIAFWADSIWSLLVMLRFCIGMLGGGMIPLSLFTPQAQEILSYLPFIYIASFPIRTLTGEVSFTQWGQGMFILFFWIAVFATVSKTVLKRGLYQYSGVGI